MTAIGRGLGSLTVRGHASKDPCITHGTTGTPAHPAKSDGTTCSQGSGIVCLCLPAQDAGGLLTLGIRGANGWSVVAQVSRSLYCDGTFFASPAGVHDPRSARHT